MTRSTAFRFGLFALVTATLVGAKCPTIPELKDKIVKLVVSESIDEDFHADGTINEETDEQEVSLDQIIDLDDLLDIETLAADAGTDLDEVNSVTLQQVLVRTKTPDPHPDRALVDATVGVSITIDGARGELVPLVTAYDIPVVNAVTEFIPVPVDPAGVAEINEALATYLEGAKSGVLPAVTLTYSWYGVSTPTEFDTDYDWTLRLVIDVDTSLEVTIIG